MCGASLLLTGCAGSGATKTPTAAINPVAGDIRAEFKRVTPLPEPPVTQSESERFAARLIASEDRKNAAGLRLMNQIDRAREFHRGE